MEDWCHSTLCGQHFSHIKDTYAALIFAESSNDSIQYFPGKKLLQQQSAGSIIRSRTAGRSVRAWNFHQNCISAVEAGSCHHWTVYRSFLLEQLDQCFILRTGSKIFWYSESADAYHEKTLNICEAEHQSWQRKDRQFRFRATPSEWHWHLSEFYQSLLFIRCFRNILSKVWLSAL